MDVGQSKAEGSRSSVERRTFLIGSAALLAGCTLQTQPEGDDARPPAAGEKGCVPLAVKVDNVGPARPHTGLKEADFVHVEQVESGLSRFLAVYATGRLPESVGPVRSARESDLDLLGQYGRPLLAYSGAQSKLQPLIAAAPLEARTPGEAEDAFYRDPDRPAPHNLFVRPARLDPRPTACDPASFGFRVGPRPPDGQDTPRHTVHYPAATFGFVWSAEEEHWRVELDGEESALTPSTVLVQHTRIRGSRFHDRWGSVTPFTETTGTGRVLLLRNGRTYEGTWTRPTADRPTDYRTADGRRLYCAKGQVWVVYVKE
ncbi:DUF3048 domain-containing protein [Streptomyces sp. B-S-A8]|uniref:DUF3048 domain-containing protein n=1 Tax=Streptomyces solicavernae TaxID=3043614 RepID=A0ABT6RLR6_9ACTN|nr:DUF3048 domain-containing protein [Streptomyces sp. B-S-A8]MDI3385383.1 DUF3048 domain-containing protein [Streptomyces sp. B-S-A8]